MFCFPFCLSAQYRINEIGYDCDISDDNEVIEVRLDNTFTGSLVDLTIILYNGNGGVPYNSETLNNFTVGRNDGMYTYYSWVPTSIMNGAPDGVSLDFQGTLVEFLSYEGTLVGTSGPANGILSTDIGVNQTNSTTCDKTLQLNNAGIWVEKLATVGNLNTCTAGLTTSITTCTARNLGTDTYTATFNFIIGSETDALTVNSNVGTPNVTTINTDGVITVTGINEGTDVILTLTNTHCSLMATAVSPICLPIPTVDARINELGYDCGESGDPNEVVEVRVENAFTGNLADLTVTLFNGNGNTAYNRETLNNFTIGANDGTYTYYTWVPTSIMNGGPDGLTLDYQGALIEFLSYEGTFTASESPATGILSTDIGSSQLNSTPCDQTLQLNNTGGWEGKTATVGNTNESLLSTSNITAIGTCNGITTSNENTFNIIISGLDATTFYDIDLNGDGVDEVTNYTGTTSFKTSPDFGTNIIFTNGTISLNVQLDAGGDGSYETMIKVHEVLCTDVDDDGDLDFSAGCDDGNTTSEKGYIVATIAPYTGENVYVYVLTNNSNHALAANTAGLFTNLASGGNGLTNDYKVIALNFANSSDANTFIGSLSFGSDSGTIVTTSTFPAACSMACGVMAYNIECTPDIAATPAPTPTVEKPKVVIPTLSQWGLSILGLLVINISIWLIYQIKVIG